MFTIIVATFNAAEFIEACLDSVITQTFPDFEILVVDGKSRDGTMALVEKVASIDSRVRYISEPDSGIYDAMNKGIKLAKRSWVMFLGSDDRLFDNEVLFDVAQYINSENGSTNVVYGDVQTYSPTSTEYKHKRYDGKFDFFKLTRKNPCHQAIFYHKDLLSRVGSYNLMFKLFADWDLNLRCWAIGSPKYINRIISLYAVTGASAQASDKAFLDTKDDLIIRYFGIKRDFLGFFRQAMPIQKFLIERMYRKSPFPELKNRLKRMMRKK